MDSDKRKTKYIFGSNNLWLTLNVYVIIVVDNIYELQMLHIYACTQKNRTTTYRFYIKNSLFNLPTTRYGTNFYSALSFVADRLCFKFIF